MLKPILWKLTFWSGALLGAAATAMAAPMRRADVPADPSWVLHVDCDALRPTAVGQYLLDEMDKPDARGKLAAFRTLFGLDPRKQLHGLTLYSTGDAPEDGAMLVYAEFDPERLVTLAKAANGAGNTPYKTHVIYNWIDDKKKPKDGVAPRTYAAIEGAGVVVFAQREKSVAQALDVLDHASPNLAAGKLFPQADAAASTCFIEAYARKLNLPNSAPNAAIFRLAKLMSLRVREADGKMTATLSLEANNEEVAKQAASVVQGLLALVKFQNAKPEAGKLAEALSLKQNGASVVATLAMPAAEVVSLLKANADKKAGQKAEKD